MTSLNLSSNLSYNTLESVLRDVLVHEQPEIKLKLDQSFQFLILTTPNDVASFTLFNDNFKQTYENSYDKFKSCYRDFHSDWSKRTLSFVLCRTKDDPEQDEFFNTIETDIYFCRKYVIQFHDSLDLLRSEVRRLPFIPLPEGGPGDISRPLSAQSLLQNMQIDSTLARHIVVPGEYSPEHILKNCLAGKYKLPDLKPLPIKSSSQAHKLPYKTRVKSLSIEGFRAYKGKQDFDLDGSIIVIYGPNGLGKTSFFDAIDYLCTGRIGRLCRRRIAKEEFIKLARHLDAPSGRIAMVADQNSRITRFSRQVEDWSVGHIDDREFDRFSFLQYLTSADWQEKSRIENLERLFRATHLFSQSDPELFQGFEDSSIIPRELVARMLALDDYASGVKKVDAVNNVIKKELKEKEKEIQIHNQLISELETRLEEFQKISVDQGPTQSIEALADFVKEEIKKAADINLPAGPYTIDSVRDWRSMLEGVQSQCNHMLKQVIILKNDSPKIRSCRNIISTFPTLVKEIEESIASNRKELSELAESLNNAQIKWENSKAKYSDSQQQYSLHVTAQNLMNRITQVSGEQDLRAKKLYEIEGEISEIDQRLNDIKANSSDIDSNLENKEAKHHEIIKKYQNFKDLVSGFPQWSQDLNNKIKIIFTITTLRHKFDDLDKEQAEIEPNILEIEQKLSQIESKYLAATRNQSQLTGLLDSLENFVLQATCPLCGADYNTVDQLVSRIHAQKEVRPIAVIQLAEQCSSLKKQLDVLGNSLEAIIKSKTEIGKLIEMASTELADASSRIDSFESKASLVGLLPISDSFSNEVQRLENEARKNTEIIAKDLDDLRHKRDLFIEENQRYQQIRGAFYENLSVTHNQFTKSQEEVGNLQNSLIKSGIPTDVTDSWIADRLKETEAEVHQTRSEFDTASIEIKRVQVQISQNNSEYQQLLNRKEEIEKEWKANLRMLQEFSHRLSQVKLPESSTLEKIEDEILALTQRRDSLDRIAGRLRLLEQASDAAARSAATADLENQIQQKTWEVQELNKDISKMSNLRTWFAKVGK